MKFENNDLKAIKTYLDDPTDQLTICQLGSIYWSSVINNICEIIHNEENVDQFLDKENDFINAGIIDKILENSNDIRTSIKINTHSYNHLKIHDTTSWVKFIINKINAGDKKDLLKVDMINLQSQQEKIDNEIGSAFQNRKDYLLKIFSENLDKKMISYINNLDSVDTLNFKNMHTKNDISKGAFLSIQKRRDLVLSINKFKQENAKRENFFSSIKSSDVQKKMRLYTNLLNDLFKKSINLDDVLEKKEEEIEETEKEQLSLSAIEVENRVQMELEYLRDLVKLSAKRLHMEGCSILRPQNKFFTKKDVCSCFDKILEFDPQIFNNNRVAIFNKPSVLIIPGEGNGLYDWKNNVFIIPMFPPAGNFMASVATAAIEYRLDVDEDKILIYSYQKLPEQKNIRSMIALREHLTKDYLKWMTSEYQGFKILNKNSRKWFEQEIAPSKNDIFTPPQYKPFSLSAKVFTNLLKTAQAAIKEKSPSPLKEDLWVAALLLYHQGKFHESFNYINELLTLYPEHIFGYYNLGIVGMKTHQKQDAIKGFSEFIKRNPQSWWASVAKDHMRRLQIG